MPQELELVTFLRSFANGEVEAEEWLQWWEASHRQLKPLVTTAELIRMRPRVLNGGTEGAVASSYRGFCRLLDSWEIAYTATERFDRAARAALERCLAEESMADAHVFDQGRPMLESMTRLFPRFAAYLLDHPKAVEKVEPPAQKEEIELLEIKLGHPLPEAYLGFLRSTRWLEAGGGLRIGLVELYLMQSRRGEVRPTDGMVSFGKYWREAGGAHVLFDLAGKSEPDPPVLYHAHESAEASIQEIASSFTGWIESLPGSEMFPE